MRAHMAETERIEEEAVLQRASQVQEKERRSSVGFLGFGGKTDEADPPAADMEFKPWPKAPPPITPKAPTY